MDLHSLCEGCLGDNHATQALSPICSFRPCLRLSLEKKQRCLALFTDQDKGFNLAEHLALDHLVDFEPGLDDLASKEEENSSPAGWHQSPGPGMPRYP